MSQIESNDSSSTRLVTLGTLSQSQKRKRALVTEVGGPSHVPATETGRPSFTIATPDDWSKYDEHTTHLIAKRGVPPERTVRYKTLSGNYVEFSGLPKVSGGDRRLTAALVSMMESTTKALNEARQEISSPEEEVSELKKARAFDAVETDHFWDDVGRMREIRNNNAVQMHHRFIECHERSVAIAGLQQRVLEIEQIQIPDGPI
jgi:hypothetical protein